MFINDDLIFKNSLLIENVQSIKICVKTASFYNFRLGSHETNSGEMLKIKYLMKTAQTCPTRHILQLSGLCRRAFNPVLCFPLTEMAKNPDFNICPICRDEIDFFSYGKCDHPTCARCAVKLRRFGSADEPDFCKCATCRARLSRVHVQFIF